MKRFKNLVHVSIILCSMVTTLYAQENARRLYVDVSGNMYHLTKRVNGGAVTTTQAVQVQTSLGYNINSWLAAGAGIGYINQPDLVLNYALSSTQSKLAGLYLRGYVLRKERLQLFLQLTQSMERDVIQIHNTYSYYGNQQTLSDEQKIKGLTTSLNVGFNYFVNSHFALQLNFGNLSYSHIVETYTSNTNQIVNSIYAPTIPTRTTTSNYFNVNMLPSSASLGILFQFGKYLEGKKEEGKKEEGK